jgi:hypothetical protein
MLPNLITRSPHGERLTVSLGKKQMQSTNSWNYFPISKERYEDSLDRVLQLCPRRKVHGYFGLIDVLSHLTMPSRELYLDSSVGNVSNGGTTQTCKFEISY